MEDFLDIINNKNFSQVLYQEDINNPLQYHCLINWGTDKYEFVQEKKEQKNTSIKKSKFLRDIENLDNPDYNKKQEREKLTAGLRYDILKRDNYRCQICGRTQADGIKLHVDHIIPIAKGGKTVPENLQTLCQDCNLGKGTKDF